MFQKVKPSDDTTTKPKVDRTIKTTKVDKIVKIPRKRTNRSDTDAKN